MYQVAEIINNRARQNSLKYASGAYLDNKAISRLLQRKQEEYAVTTIRFTLSAVRENVIAIPVGTRVTGESGNVYFATSEYAEILPGNLLTFYVLQQTAAVLQIIMKSGNFRH